MEDEIAFLINYYKIFKRLKDKKIEEKLTEKNQKSHSRYIMCVRRNRNAIQRKYGRRDHHSLTGNFRKKG